jgi:hypothetical protein
MNLLWKCVQVSILLTAIAYGANAQEAPKQGISKKFTCSLHSGGFGGSVTFNAPDLATAIALYQIGVVYPKQAGGNTFSGASYDLTEEEVFCKEEKSNDSPSASVNNTNSSSD